MLSSLRMLAGRLEYQRFYCFCEKKNKRSSQNRIVIIHKYWFDQNGFFVIVLTIQSKEFIG